MDFIPFMIICSSLFAFTISHKIGLNDVQHFLDVPTRNVFLHANNHELISKHDKGQESEKLGIINGDPVKDRKLFCFIVFLVFSNQDSQWACGGSLLNNRTILTAAHCALGANWVQVLLGSVNLRDNKERGRVVLEFQLNSTNLFIHTRYDTKQYYNDIALVMVPKSQLPIQLNDYVCIIKLPDCSPGECGRQCRNNNVFTISGWGKTSNNGGVSSQLMAADVPEQPLAKCQAEYRKWANYYVTNTQVCSDGNSTTRPMGTCNGDSGGPVVQVNYCGQKVVIGIVSLGMSNCTAGFSSVYTDVSCYITWIRKTIEDFNNAK